MTTREFYSAIAKADLSVDLTDKANELLQAMDARNEKRKSSESKDKLEAAARREAVRQYLMAQSSPATRDMIAAALNITPAQASSAAARIEGVNKGIMKVGKEKYVTYSITR